MSEDACASVLLARYPMRLIEPMIDFAISMEMYAFLRNIFFFQKNTIHEEEVQSNSQDEEEPVRIFTFEVLLTKIDDMLEE